MSTIYPNRSQSGLVLLPIFLLLFSAVANVDQLTVLPDSFYLYKIDLEKGVTLRGKIIISKTESPITVEIHDPGGEVIEKVSVLKEMDVEFVSDQAGMYDIRFQNHKSDLPVEVTFSFEVKRDLPIIPAFPIWSFVIGTLFFLILNSKMNAI